jgi:hypothetical protein
MLDHDQANDRAWDRLLEHLDTAVATAEDFADFDATPPAPMPEAKVAAIVARATGNHRRNRRAVTGVMLAAATLLIAVVIAGVTSHSVRPPANQYKVASAVPLPTLTPAEALRILHDPNRDKGDYQSAMGRTIYTALQSIAWLRATIRSREAAPEVVRCAEVRIIGLLRTSDGTAHQDPPVRPATLSLPDSTEAITCADVERVADVACYAMSAFSGFATSDGELESARIGCLQKIHRWLWMSVILDIFRVSV